MVRLYSIYAIKKAYGPPFKTTVTRLVGKSNYQNILGPYPTPLGKTDTNFAFSMNDMGDIFAIQEAGLNPDPNLDRTSLYILDWHSTWGQFLTNNNPAPTSLTRTDNNWEF